MSGIATTPSSQARRTGLERARWALADTWTITLRALQHWARQPFVLVVGLLFPILMLLMFGYLLRGGYGSDYPSILLPAMLALSAVWGLEATMSAIVADAQRGITDRFRSLPMANGAVIAGRGVADMLNAAAGMLVLMACGFVIGWRWEDGLANGLLALVLLLWLRFAMIWVGLYLGLVAGKPEIVATVQILVWPLGFLSNAFSDPATMPSWLGAIAEWNPLSATVAAARELFGNPGWESSAWIASHAVQMAIVWPLLLTAILPARGREVPRAVAVARRLRSSRAVRTPHGARALPASARGGAPRSFSVSEAQRGTPLPTAPPAALAEAGEPAAPAAAARRGVPPRDGDARRASGPPAPAAAARRGVPPRDGDARRASGPPRPGRHRRAPGPAAIAAPAAASCPAAGGRRRRAAGWPTPAPQPGTPRAAG